MTMIYELRIYHVAQGKMAALHERFQKFTLAAWAKHVLARVGFWTVLVGPDSNRLYYLLAWGRHGRARAEVRRVPKRSGVDCDQRPWPERLRCNGSGTARA